MQSLDKPYSSTGPASPGLKSGLAHREVCQAHNCANVSWFYGNQMIGADIREDRHVDVLKKDAGVSSPQELAECMDEWEDWKL